MLRRLLEILTRRDPWTHTNPYNAHQRTMMAIDRQEKEAPWLDSRYQGIPITEYQWQLMFNNMEYRDKHYWQINRGNG